jgi:hypothetical protein
MDKVKIIIISILLSVGNSSFSKEKSYDFQYEKTLEKECQKKMEDGYQWGKEHGMHESDHEASMLKHHNQWKKNQEQDITIHDKELN